MNKLWFKRKAYGWGWYPSSWQGWLVVLLHMAIVLVIAFSVEEDAKSKDLVFSFYLPLIISTTTMIYICLKKGEKPRWQWGSKTKDLEN